jgi:site-specific recombinase XerD
VAIQPFFEPHPRFLKLNYNNLEDELPAVKAYLDTFPKSLNATESYKAVRRFLRLYSKNKATFTTYRTHIERLLLWSLLIAKKDLSKLNPQDAQDFLDFSANPPTTWIGPVVKSRFIRQGGRKAAKSDTYLVNDVWRPFNYTTDKRTAKIAEENNDPLPPPSYTMASDSVTMVFAVCGSFFKFAAGDRFTDQVNPFQAIGQKSEYKNNEETVIKSRSLTHLQWNFVISTAEEMADLQPEVHERTLFILATMFSMYLRVSDVVGRRNWKPKMNAFKRDSDGFWWFSVTGKGNKTAEVSVKQEYIDVYLARYRKFLKLPVLPSRDESTPLITTLKGRAGLSDRHIRLLLQEVFDRAIEKMKAEGRKDDEIDDLRSASLHTLRHTSATFDSKVRTDKDLQADLRHSSLSTTQDTYFNSLKTDRGRSNQGLSIKDR